MPNDITFAPPADTLTTDERLAELAAKCCQTEVSDQFELVSTTAV